MRSEAAGRVAGHCWPRLFVDVFCSVFVLLSVSGSPFVCSVRLSQGFLSCPFCFFSLSLFPSLSLSLSFLTEARSLILLALLSSSQMLTQEMPGTHLTHTHTHTCSLCLSLFLSVCLSLSLCLCLSVSLCLSPPVTLTLSKTVEK